RETSQTRAAEKSTAALQSPKQVLATRQDRSRPMAFLANSKDTPRVGASRPGRGIGLLVEPEHVAIRIGEASRQLRGVHPKGLNDAAAVGDDRLHGLGNAVHHDIKK